MSRTLQADKQNIRQRVLLSEISKDLGLSNRVLHELQDIGIRSAQDFLGLIHAAFEDIVHDLDISPEDLYEIGQRLRKYIDPGTLQEIEDIKQDSSSLPTGAELRPAPHRDKIPEYEEE